MNDPAVAPNLGLDERHSVRMNLIQPPANFQPLFNRHNAAWEFPLSKVETNDRLTLKLGLELEQEQEQNALLRERADVRDFRTGVELTWDVEERKRLMNEMR